VSIKSFEQEFPVFELPVLHHFLKLPDDGMVDKAGFRKVEPDLGNSVKGEQLAAYSQPIAEDESFAESDNGFAGDRIPFGLDLGFEEVAQGDAGAEVKDQLGNDAGRDAEEKVGGEGDDHGDHKDEQLTLSDGPHVMEFPWRSEIVAGEDEHGSEGGQRDHVQEPWHAGDEDEQERSVPEVGPAGACAIVPVGGGTHDFRDHGDAADAGDEGVGRSHCEEVAVQIRAPLPWIKEIDGFRAEERF